MLLACGFVLLFVFECFSVGFDICLLLGLFMVLGGYSASGFVGIRFGLVFVVIGL